MARSAKRHALKAIPEAAHVCHAPHTGKTPSLGRCVEDVGLQVSAHTHTSSRSQTVSHRERLALVQPSDRHFKPCTEAVKRGMGPAKKAPEVPEEIWKARPLLPDEGSTTGKVKLGAHLFACGVHWVMREIEIAALTAKNAVFDDKSRLVTLMWQESKMDQEGATISRTLQCFCSGACDISCPYAVLEVLVNHACLHVTEVLHSLSASKVRRRPKHNW